MYDFSDPEAVLTGYFGCWFGIIFFFGSYSRCWWLFSYLWNDCRLQSTGCSPAGDIYRADRDILLQ